MIKNSKTDLSLDREIVYMYFFLGLSVPGVPPANPAVSILHTPVNIPLPTPCLMISNMFDPTK